MLTTADWLLSSSSQSATGLWTDDTMKGQYLVFTDSLKKKREWERDKALCVLLTFYSLPNYETYSDMLELENILLCPNNSSSRTVELQRKKLLQILCLSFRILFDIDCCVTLFFKAWFETWLDLSLLVMTGSTPNVHTVHFRFSFGRFLLFLKHSGNGVPCDLSVC